MKKDKPSPAREDKTWQKGFQQNNIVLSPLSILPHVRATAPHKLTGGL
jgi:hypothetical protein